MHVSELTIYAVRLPLRKTIAHASAVRRASDSLVARCRLADGTEGWGEGVPRAYVTGETIEGALEQLAASDLAGQLGEDAGSWAEVIRMCERLRLRPVGDDPRGCQGNAARCAVELSVLDAYGRLFGDPLRAVTAMYEPARHIAACHAHVRYSTTITAGSPAAERLAAVTMRLYGFQQCKVKVGMPALDDRRRLARIRRWIGRSVDLRLDANEAWPAERLVERVEPLLECGISCIEQPVAHREVGALAQLRLRLPVPVMLDESLTSVTDAERAVRERLCDLFNIRLSKCGGFLASLRLAALAHDAGLGYQLGCHPGESPVLSAAGRHWATSVAGIRYLEGSYDRHLLRERISREDITFGYGGCAPALRGPGLGITVDAAAIERLAVRQAAFPLDRSSPARRAPGRISAAAPRPAGPAPRIVRVEADDGYRYAVRIWEASKPAGQAVLLHGIVSHSGWYQRTGRALVELGLNVHMPDRRGSGLNLQQRGDVGHWQRWLDDVRHYLATLPDALPTVLLGVSWGGKLAVALARQETPLCGLALVCPGLFARQLPGRAQRAAVRLANQLGLGARRVPIPLRDPELFTDTPEWKQYVATDPLTLRRVTLRFALADVRLTQYAVERPEAIRVPTLLMLAGRDRIVHNERTRQFVERFGGGDVRVIGYDQASHTLEFERDPARYLRDLGRWTRDACTR